MSDNIKKNLLKHENSISALENKFKQMQFILEEEHQRSSDSMADLKLQMKQRTTVNADSGKRFNELLELLKGTAKGKQAETPEMGSSTQIPKTVHPRNTGYPPGFVPTTPTNYATYNEPWDEVNSKSGPANIGGSSTPLEGTLFFQAAHPGKVRPPPNPNLQFSQYTPHTAQTVMGTTLPPLLQQYLSSLNYNVDSVPWQPVSQPAVTTGYPSTYTGQTLPHHQFQHNPQPNYLNQPFNHNPQQPYQTHFQTQHTNPTPYQPHNIPPYQQQFQNPPVYQPNVNQYQQPHNTNHH